MRTPSTGRTDRNRLRMVMAGALLLMILFTTGVQAAGPWWDASWDYRVRLTVGSGGFTRFDKAAEQAVNYTTLLSALGKSGALDENSLRVIETNAAGTIVNTSVPFQFDKDADYDASSKASGTMVILSLIHI